MLASQQVAECLTIAAILRGQGDLGAARHWTAKARDWRVNGAAELVSNRIYELTHPSVMHRHAMAPAPLQARPMSKRDAARLFEAADDAWSAQIERFYGRAGSMAYDKARYRTPHAQWPLQVRLAYQVRDEARLAWEALAFPHLLAA